MVGLYGNARSEQDRRPTVRLWTPAPRVALAAMLLSALLALWGAASAFAEEESNDGLPSGVPAPSWAIGKQIHFDPVRPASSLTEQGALTPLVEEGPLKYFKGPVEYEPTLFLIFWGKNWTMEPGQALKTELLKMYEGLGESAYPALDSKCKTYIGSYSDECAIGASTHMSNASGGVVEAVFDAKSTKTHCSATGKGDEAGDVQGSLKIKATSKEVEAIKVE